GGKGVCTGRARGRRLGGDPMIAASRVTPVDHWAVYDPSPGACRICDHGFDARRPSRRDPSICKRCASVVAERAAVAARVPALVVALREGWGLLEPPHGVGTPKREPWMDWRTWAQVPLFARAP